MEIKIFICLSEIKLRLDPGQFTTRRGLTIEDSVFHTIQEDIPSKTIIMAYKIATDVKIIVFSTI